MTLETLLTAVPGLKDRDRDEVGALSVVKCSQIHLLNYSERRQTAFGGSSDGC